MKLSEIIKRVQRQFGDDVEAQITEEDIIRWVNDACSEIAANNSTNQGFLGSTPVVAGQQEYKLPADLLKLRSVRVNGARMSPTTYEQLMEIDPDALNTEGTPNQYWIFGNKIYLYPTPVEALGEVHVLYTKTPDILTSGHKNREPDVPIQYHPRIVEYCIAQAAELDDNIAQYQLKMSEFSNKLQGARANDDTPETDSAYPSITYVGEWY